MEQKYNMSVLPLDCKRLKKEDVYRIMETILSDFPIGRINFFLPKWVEFLDRDHGWKYITKNSNERLISDSVNVVAISKIIQSVWEERLGKCS